MRPANFPGRKNDRRKRALKRMKAPEPGMSHADLSEHPFVRTKLRIVPDEMARAVRTKKDRSSRARVRP